MRRHKRENQSVKEYAIGRMVSGSGRKRRVRKLVRLFVDAISVGTAHGIGIVSGKLSDIPLRRL